MDDTRNWREIAGVMLLVGALPIPIYAYYIFLRILVCLTCILIIIQARKGKIGSPMMYVLLAILFNPVIPIHLPKMVWFPIDIAAGLILLLGGRKKD